MFFMVQEERGGDAIEKEMLLMDFGWRRLVGGEGKKGAIGERGG